MKEEKKRRRFLALSAFKEDDYFEDEGIKSDFDDNILCSIGNGPFAPYSDVKRGFEEIEDAEFEVIEPKKIVDKQY